MSQETTKKIKPINNESNMKNANKGTDGTNRQYGKVHGNRGKQLQPSSLEKFLKGED